MTTPAWQKSSSCAQGEACLHVASTSSTRTVKLTESSDATRAILHTTPDTWAAFLRTVKEHAPHA
ncbi:DUF397 domain-containing protein [Streptomyces sp. 21So2-11]|uniref:DUF397 domain-containing protein n=1 Tax=Streptomyces sp. 21So2-11 TaxID=3144408 RepID=UPI003219DA01